MIVVGIDGSPGSRAALRFAAEESGLRQTTLKVVTAWHVPTLANMPPMAVSPDEFHQAAVEAAEREVVEVLGADRPSAVDVVTRQGNAAEALLAESRDAQMLVVGSRGHGGFAGLLLGSVSHQCAAHATCPVVVVRDHGAE